MLASKKYWRWQNVGVDKIFALTNYSYRLNVGVDKVFASTKCWRMPESISLLFRPGRVRSSWLFPDLAEVLLLLPVVVDPSMCSRQVCCCCWPPCFFERTLSHTVLAYCTKPPCRKRHKYCRRQNIDARQDFTNFRQTIAVNISAHNISAYKKMVKARSDHHLCPISVLITSKLRPSQRSNVEVSECSKGVWVAGGGGLLMLYLLHLPWQVVEVNCRMLCTQDTTPPPSPNCLFLFLHLPLSHSKLDGGVWKNPH